MPNASARGYSISARIQRWRFPRHQWESNVAIGVHNQSCTLAFTHNLFKWILKLTENFYRHQRFNCTLSLHGLLTIYAKLWVAHPPWMPGTFSQPPRVSDPDMQYGTCATHVLWCMSGSLTSGFLWSRFAGKTFPAFLAHAQPAIFVSGMKPMVYNICVICLDYWLRLHAL